MSKILVVDDELDMLKLIENILKRDGHEVKVISDVENIFDIDYNPFNLIILDVMMLKMDGFEVCKIIRNKVDCPILFLTAKNMESDVMYGLGIGADDYITKPFGVGELRARINAHLRRENREKKNSLTISNVQFNFLGKEISVDNNKINFTKSEYLICEFLAKNKGQVFSKERIYEHIYGFDGESDISVITEHIKNIRSKLKSYDIYTIETVWGIGYKWI
ncbi:response regulator transcription factor [Clostridioides sp. ES-S-0048-02]|uniref:response regulator transcription factor n=1 Tax=Clostridioides sp. ES-S-0048-02 TaxID=2770777 RepID=UPI001D11FAD9|nr:response regulator transcription factor [Clostridioides sp. ES-S-0048-02]